MINTNSTAYKLSEKVGLVIGKGIRYIVIGGIAVFIGVKLGGSTPSQPPPPPPPPAP
jgi:hypothetical protein